MSTSVRNLLAPLMAANITGDNASRLDMLKLRAGLIFHADATVAVSTANAVSGDGYVSSIALVNSCATAYTAHLASVCDAILGIGSHISADSTNVISASTAVDFPSAETLANQLKTQFNAHIASAVFHPVADSLDTVSAASATSDVTLAALCNALKVGINAHFAAAFNSQSIVTVLP